MPTHDRLAGLSLEERIGQLISTTIYHEPDAVERMVAAGHLGALWVSWQDLDGSLQAARFVERFQKVARVPLLIGADFESGVGRLLPGATALPTLMALGATGSEELARAHAHVTAVEAAAVGVRHVFGPVLDVNVNPANPIVNVRAFGGDPDLVGRLGTAWIAGCQDEGVLAAAKHFPGHGDTALDTHLELATVPHELARVERVELAPFRAAIAAGVASIMTAHLAFPALDPSGLPATLSSAVLNGLLRGRLGFSGLVVTDAMEMDAVRRQFGVGEAAVRAVAAGADLLLAHDPAATHEALLTAAREGRLGLDRVDDAAGRVLAAKERAGLFEERRARRGHAAIVCSEPEHREVARRIAEAAFTAVSGELARPEGAPWLLLVPDCHRYTGESLLREVARHLRDGTLPGARLVGITDDPSPAEIEGLEGDRRDARGATLLTVALARAGQPEASRPSPGQVRLVEALAAHLPVSVVSLGSPYVLPAFARATALGCAYGADPSSVRATLDVLAGRLRPQGRLPVELAG